MSDEDLFEVSKAIYDINFDDGDSVEILEKPSRQPPKQVLVAVPSDSFDSPRSSDSSRSSVSDSPRVGTHHQQRPLFSPRNEGGPSSPKVSESPRWRTSSVSSVGGGTVRVTGAAGPLQQPVLSSSQDVLIGARRTKETLQLIEEVTVCFAFSTPTLILACFVIFPHHLYSGFFVEG